MKNLVVSLELDKRRIKKNGTYPIKIRVTFLREPRRYSTGYSVSENQWNKMYSAPGSKIKKVKNKSIKQYSETQLSTIRKKIEAQLERAESITGSLSIFSFGQFEKKLLGKKTSYPAEIFDAFEWYRNKLSKEGRASTASGYELASKSFKSYTSNHRLRFGDIDSEWLNGYESFMLKNKRSSSTVGIYCRYLRRLYNLAIKEGKADKDSYPFGTDSYIIPGSRNKKQALSFQDVNKIYSYNSSSESINKWKDFWMFSYLASGMNMRDICELKWKDFFDDKLEFVRSKTARANKDRQESIVIPLFGPLLEIFERHCIKSDDPNDFIFPFINNEMDPLQRLNTIKQQTKNINKAMKKLSNEIDLSFIPTFQVARHSYANISKNTGASIEFISSALGHRSTKTTKLYLGSLEEEKLREHQAKLLSPINKSNLNEKVS